MFTVPSPPAVNQMTSLMNKRDIFRVHFPIQLDQIFVTSHTGLLVPIYTTVNSFILRRPYVETPCLQDRLFLHRYYHRSRFFHGLPIMQIISLSSLLHESYSASVPVNRQLNWKCL